MLMCTSVLVFYLLNYEADDYYLILMFWAKKPLRFKVIDTELCLYVDLLVLNYDTLFLQMKF